MLALVTVVLLLRRGLFPFFDWGCVCVGLLPYPLVHGESRIVLQLSQKWYAQTLVRHSRQQTAVLPPGE